MDNCFNIKLSKASLNNWELGMMKWKMYMLEMNNCD